MGSPSKKRIVIGIGVSFIVVSALYAALAQPLGYHVEWAGVTMLLALGIAMGLMAYVLSAGLND